MGATSYAMTRSSSDKLRVRYQHDREEQLNTAPPADQRDSLSYLAAVLAGRLPAKGDLSALDSTNVTVMRILDAARRGTGSRNSAKATSRLRIEPAT